ncbi:putative PEP-binding protein [Streptomyces erythrochromogenes]|uniref:putative PEP-binding protein n=1 Tax=Streptomyces erythrochromogenes TaxID=285574 RepID=UPI0038293C9F
MARPVVVRTGDFQTNEYARLPGGRPFEPVEANPMIGWRGGSRYYSDGYREGFALECRALRRKTSGAARTARRRTGPLRGGPNGPIRDPMAPSGAALRLTTVKEDTT